MIVDDARDGPPYLALPDLELGHGLKMRATAEHVWLIFPPVEVGRGMQHAVSLTMRAQCSPVFLRCLLAWLEEHMPDAGRARAYLERIGDTVARLEKKRWGDSPPPEPGA